MSRSGVSFRVLSRTNLAGSSPSTSFTFSISFAFFRLRTLFLSLRSFSHPGPLFSITSALFSQNTGGVVSRMPLRDTRGGGISTRPRHALLRRHMHHVAPLSPVPSLDCAYFLSPRGLEGSAIFSRHSPLATFPPPFVF